MDREGKKEEDELRFGGRIFGKGRLPHFLWVYGTSIRITYY